MHAQYNWGYPAVLKNAIDYLYHEWKGKPAAIVSYGGHGGGKGAAQLHQVSSTLQLCSKDIYSKCCVKPPAAIQALGSAAQAEVEICSCSAALVRRHLRRAKSICLHDDDYVDPACLLPVESPAAGIPAVCSSIMTANGASLQVLNELRMRVVDLMPALTLARAQQAGGMTSEDVESAFADSAMEILSAARQLEDLVCAA